MEDTDKIKKEAHLLKLPGLGLEEIVYILKKYDNNGQRAFCEFNGILLFSDDITMEKAYQQVYGTDFSAEKEEVKDYQDLKANRRASINPEDQSNIDKTKEVRDREKSEGIFEINKNNVIRGLKFMAENVGMPQSQYVEGLIYRGCTFTQKDISQELGGEIKLPDDFWANGIKTGAFLIAMARDAYDSRKMIEDTYLSIDDSNSLYEYIRNLTNDKQYTKQYADSLNKYRKKL